MKKKNNIGSAFRFFIFQVSKLYSSNGITSGEFMKMLLLFLSLFLIYSRQNEPKERINIPKYSTLIPQKDWLLSSEVIKRNTPAAIKQIPKMAPIIFRQLNNSMLSKTQTHTDIQTIPKSPYSEKLTAAAPIPIRTSQATMKSIQKEIESLKKLKLR